MVKCNSLHQLWNFSKVFGVLLVLANTPNIYNATRSENLSMPQPSKRPIDLNRFIQAQEEDYEIALNEIRSAKKRSHWMWYTFPQFAGLGLSSTSQHFAIKSVAEAKAYLGHSILGKRLLECCEAMLQINGRTAREVLGSPDDLKLCSCATLFATISPAESVFHQILEKYFGGHRDEKTLELIQQDGDSSGSVLPPRT